MQPSVLFLANPLVRTALTIVLVIFSMSALLKQWQRLSNYDRKGVIEQSSSSLNTEEDGLVHPKLVVAHFMLGNTYAYSDDQWIRTFESAEETGFDALVLNLGFEEWQITRAKQAFEVLSSFSAPLPTPTRLKLCLSLDMNVLPSSSTLNSIQLAETVRNLITRDEYLQFRGRPLLSTFSGHSSSFGGEGWSGFLGRVNQDRKPDHKVFFIPAFFIPPQDFLALEEIDGTFAWNNAWPDRNESISLDRDLPFLKSSKPYMAAVSPLFFTHYGKTGQWAWNKNWIYPSDQLLYPTRWNHLIGASGRENASKGRGPDIIQVISWNDFGESHYISPVFGDQPGSQAWTDEMDHVGFREMTRYFIGRWRDSLGEVDFPSIDRATRPLQTEDHDPEVSVISSFSKGSDIVVFMWYRPHVSDMEATDDAVGKPDNTEWAKDLINFLIIIPPSSTIHHLRLHTGEINTLTPLTNGIANMLTMPFEPGPVKFEVTKNGGSWRSDNILHGVGREILAQDSKWNFNMWSGVWRVPV